MEDSDVLNLCIIATDLGWVGVISSNIGLKGLILPKSSKDTVFQAAAQKYGIARETTPDFLGDLPQRLQSYFSGKYTDFPDVIDFRGYSGFQQSIWKTTRTIPYGETRSYAWIACQSGFTKAARATGQALGKNPFPIIVPCHRVIRSDGSIGGFTGGIALKKYFLMLEKSTE